MIIGARREKLELVVQEKTAIIYTAKKSVFSFFLATEKNGLRSGKNESEVKTVRVVQWLWNEK